MKIVVLCGGLSAERDVSITSGTQVALALRESGHSVVLIDVFFGYTGSYAEPGELFSRNEPIERRAVAEAEPDLEAVRAAGSRDGGSLIGENVMEICRAADITFLALHGDMGENGKLQAALDIMGIKYTGSGYLGSALAMNKSLSKLLFKNAGILTPDGITVYREKIPCADIGFPCVVKPCSGGSSVGTAIVETNVGYEKALESAFKYDDAVIAEEYINGRELTVGVLGGKAMPVIEIVPKQGFYDYRNKYQAGLTEEICPAGIGDELTKKVQALAERVQRTLMIDSYCRVDLIMSEAGELFVLEANTLPGMTPVSLIPRMGLAMGLSFGQLCEKIIDVSMEKYR